MEINPLEAHHHFIKSNWLSLAITFGVLDLTQLADDHLIPLYYIQDCLSLFLLLLGKEVGHSVASMS